jgi:hypothetical protein
MSARMMIMHHLITNTDCTALPMTQGGTVTGKVIDAMMRRQHEIWRNIRKLAVEDDVDCTQCHLIRV